MNSIKTETQWGNNIIINVNVICRGDSLPDSFLQKIKRQIFEAINSSRHGAEMWDKYEKTVLVDENVIGKLPPTELNK
jgi:hypothetical protein